MQLPRASGLAQCLSGIFYWLHNAQINDLWKCLWPRNWATGFRNKKISKNGWLLSVDTDCSPDPPWGHPLPALWMQIKPFVQDIYSEYFFLFLHPLLWKHWHDNLHFQSTVSRRKTSGLKDDHLQQFKELLRAIYRSRENTHKSSTWWSKAPS